MAVSLNEDKRFQRFGNCTQSGMYLLRGRSVVVGCPGGEGRIVAALHVAGRAAEAARGGGAARVHLVVVSAPVPHVRR